MATASEPTRVDAHTVLELLPHGVLVLAADWQVAYANTEAARLLGDGGGTLWERCPALETTAFASSFRYAMADRTELITESALPGVGWCQARARPTPDGGLVVGLRQVHGHALDTAQARLALLIGEVGDALAREESLPAALGRCAAALVRHLEVAGARIWVRESAAADLLALRGAAGLPGEDAAAPALVGEGVIGRVAESGAPCLTNEAGQDPQIADAAWARQPGVVAFAAYPLRVEDRVLGVLALAGRRPIDHALLNALSTIVDALSLGIARKLADAETRALLVELGRANAALARSIAALERSNAELDRFAYVASHDLRAPLRGIANLATWIEEDLAPHMTPQAREHMALLRDRVVRLETLIGGILAYSRAGRGGAGDVEVDLAAAAREAWELLAPPPTATLAIVAPPHGAGGTTLRADRAQLQQILLNLLGNALKHNADRAVRVEVRARRDGDAWEVAVADDGVGISAEFQDRVWELFQTLPHRDAPESSGIGLAVVRKLVEGRGGRAWLASAPGAGATFFVRWPDASPAG